MNHVKQHGMSLGPCPSFAPTLVFVAIFSLALQSAGESAAMDLKEFGVVGDGQADDTAAIQRAIDSGLGSIRFAKGVYRISKTLIIELDKTGLTSLHGDGVATIRMEGAGPAVKFVSTHVRGGAGSGFKDGFWDRERMTPLAATGVV